MVGAVFIDYNYIITCSGVYVKYCEWLCRVVIKFASSCGKCLISLISSFVRFRSG